MDNFRNIPHTATNVTYAEIPLCPINPIGRKGDPVAGFLTYDAGHQLQLRVQSRHITVFPIIPFRGTIVGTAIINS